MRITIAERLKPFSHHPGTSFVLSDSSLSLEIFPNLILVNDLAEAYPTPVDGITLDLEGPIEGFTVLQDLEKGTITVFGKSVKGYFRYVLKKMVDGSGMIIAIEKTPPQGMMFSSLEKGLGHPSPVFPGQKLILLSQRLPVAKMASLDTLERLSLGSHKKQDWELVSRRLSFTEIFPVWHRLGQMVAEPASNELAGVSTLLRNCHEMIQGNNPEKILPEFKKVFLAGFSGVLSPRLVDMAHQGIHYPEIDQTASANLSAIPLLTEGAKLIRSLFIQEKNNEVHLLPALPPEFHCGRLIQAKCGQEGMLAMEWTKKSIRLMTFQANQNQTITFFFSNHERKCRLRTSNKDRGVVYIPGSPLEITGGQHYWFDHFER